MQWLELTDGTICELTGCSISVRRDVQGILGVVDCLSDFQIQLSGGHRVIGKGKDYIALVGESDAEEVMLSSNLGSDLIKAIFSLSRHPEIAASRLAQAAYSIAKDRQSNTPSSRAAATAAHGND